MGFLPWMGTKALEGRYRNRLLSGGRNMARAEDYRRNAAECVRLAQQIASPSDKATLLQMAQKWRELAERVGRENESQQRNFYP
jgi:hypothetical protein